MVPEALARQQDPEDQQRLADRQDLVIPLGRRDPAVRLRLFHPLVLEYPLDLAGRQRLADREVLLGRQGQAPARNRLSAKTPIVKGEILNACDYLPASVLCETSIGNSPRVKAFRRGSAASDDEKDPAQGDGGAVGGS